MDLLDYQWIGLAIMALGALIFLPSIIERMGHAFLAWDRRDMDGWTVTPRDTIHDTLRAEYDAAGRALPGVDWAAREAELRGGAS